MTAIWIRVLLISIPLNILGIFVSDRLIVPSMVALAVVAVIALANILLGSGPFRPRWGEDRWLLPFVAFLAVAAVSLLMSPYFQAALSKGVIQLLGISSAILAAYGISKRCSANPRLFRGFCRIIAVVMGWVALIGIAQFVLWNVFGLYHVLNFSFMNELHGRIVWRETGTVGDTYRISSILAEPAYMTRVLGVSCGLALVRLGLAGKVLKRGLRGIVPLWAALAIVACYLLSTSLLGYMHVVVVAVATWVVSTRISVRSAIRLSAMSAFAIAVTAGYVMTQGDDFVEKTATIALITDADESAMTTSFRSETQSALAIAINLQLAVDNFLRSPVLGAGVGAHPVTYYAEVPDVSEYVYGLNVDDAASLSLRLLSETGLAGLLTFLIALGYPVVLARRSFLAAGPAVSVEALQSRAIAVAVLGSWVGMALVYLARTGLYFDAPFWVMIGLVAALPKFLRWHNPGPPAHA